MSDSHDSPTSTSSDSHESSPSKTPNSFVLQTPIMPVDRSRRRNVHIYDAKNPTVVLGGLMLSNGVTKANLYSMLDIFIVYGPPREMPLDEEKPFLRDKEGTKIEKNDDPLQPGEYYIVTTCAIQVTNETALLRTTTTRQTGTRVRSFRNAVRSRDRRCVISGEEADGADYDDWTGFEAAHIFPLALRNVWKDCNIGRWITIPPTNEKAGTINSVQNGLLLTSTLHQRFDTYAFSINPDDNYKIVFFLSGGKTLAGKHLDQTFLNHPQRPVDELLRWHFQQAVLTNMKGAGEPIFEHDFPPGSDIVGDILRGPRAAERMEFELFSRLGGQVEMDYPEAAQEVLREGISA